MNTPANDGATVGRAVRCSVVVSPLAWPSLQIHAAVTPQVAAIKLSGSAPAAKHRAAANVASVTWGYI